MAINIQNLLSAANAKIGVAAVDAADSARLASLTNFVNNHRNTQTFASFASLPTADSSNFGQIVRVAADSAGTYLDSGAAFYVSYRDQWKQVLFSGDSDVAQVEPYKFQGSNFGYASGGTTYPAVPSRLNTIDKFSFTSDANAVDVADLFASKYFMAGQSSSTHGYVSGGRTNVSAINSIDKFSFSVDQNATDVGNLIIARTEVAGQSSSTHGYTSGGDNSGPTNYNYIDKFSFSVDQNATGVGALTAAREAVTGQSSSTHGYTCGGSTNSNIIEKFPFAVDENATDVGDLTQVHDAPGGQSSSTHGYVSGGLTGSPSGSILTGVISKFTFASDANASGVGNLSATKSYVSGQSSTTDGYASGGNDGPAPGNNFVNTIDKFPFASDTSAANVASLSAVKYGTAGQQY